MILQSKKKKKEKKDVSSFLIPSPGGKSHEDKKFILFTTLFSGPTKCQAQNKYSIYISWKKKNWNQTNLHTFEFQLRHEQWPGQVSLPLSFYLTTQ